MEININKKKDDQREKLKKLLKMQSTKEVKHRHDNFQCLIKRCDKVYSSKAALSYHMRVKHGIFCNKNKLIHNKYPLENGEAELLLENYKCQKAIRSTHKQCLLTKQYTPCQCPSSDLSQDFAHQTARYTEELSSKMQNLDTKIEKFWKENQENPSTFFMKDYLDVYGTAEQPNDKGTQT